MIVGVPCDLVSVGAELLAEPLAGGPVAVLAQDVVVDVLEELELDRVAEPLGRLEAVEDHAPDSPGEVLVEEADRAPEDPRQLRLPFVPGFGIEVRPAHPPAGPVDRVEVSAERPGPGPRRPRTRDSASRGRARSSQLNWERAYDR